MKDCASMEEWTQKRVIILIEIFTAETLLNMQVILLFNRLTFR